MIFPADIDAFVLSDAKGRAGSPLPAASWNGRVRAYHDGAHGVTRPTSLNRAEIVVICHRIKNKTPLEWILFPAE
jgi:hypothetical protein